MHPKAAAPTLSTRQPAAQGQPGLFTRGEAPRERLDATLTSEIVRLATLILEVLLNRLGAA